MKRFEKPRGQPENARNLSPNRRIIGKIEEKDAREENDPAECQIVRRYRLKPKIPPTLTQGLHQAPFLPQYCVTVSSVSERSGRSTFLAHGSSCQKSRSSSIPWRGGPS